MSILKLSPKTIESYSTEFPLAYFDSQHSNTIAFGKNSIELTTSPVTITPGSTYGAHVIPISIDSLGDAVPTTISGISVLLYGIDLISQNTSGSWPDGITVGGNMKIGTVNEDFNNSTTTFSDILGWQSLSYEQTHYHEMYTKRDSVSSYSLQTVRTSSAAATGLYEITNIDPTVLGLGAFSREVTAIVIYYQYDDDCFSNMATALAEVNNDTNKYYIDV